MNLVVGKNEVEESFEKYGLKNKRIALFSETTDEAEKFCWFIRNGELVPFEEPDAYIKIENEILVIEHFRIDGYETFSNGGSVLISNENKISKQPFVKIGNTSVRNVQIGTINAYDRYIVNAKARFDKHYRRIKEYKKNLIAKGIADNSSEFIVCFLMDDVSPLGTLTSDGDKIYPVCLAKSKEFLDYFEGKTAVDWIISAVQIESDYYPYFFSRNDIEDCSKQAIDYSKLQFLGSNTGCIDFQVEL